MSVLCRRCGHVQEIHDNGSGYCMAGHRGNLGSIDPCGCERMVAVTTTVLDQALSAIGYARSHLALNPQDLPAIVRYLSSEQRRIFALRT